MPTYDYVCDACDHKFEHFQGINDPLLMKCSECGKKKLRRLFGTGAALMFKGSGFYTTDYRSESYQKGADAEKSSQKSANGEGKSGEGKSDLRRNERNTQLCPIRRQGREPQSGFD